MNIPRLCVTSASGSGGKTLLSIGLGRALSHLRIKPFKKGPDYIDAAWLSAACGTPATNLDLFFMDRERLASFFIESMQGYELALIEGNRGLYDGLDLEGSCSTAALAQELSCPVLLCLDCTKATRTMAAVLNGIVNFEKGLTFCGVILNRVGSPRHEKALVSAINEYTDIPILGILPKLRVNPLPERHMGLASQDIQNSDKLEAGIEKLGNLVKENCDAKAILGAFHKGRQIETSLQITSKTPPLLHSAKIGYVKDKAFWFYYPENMAALENAGAEIIRLSLFDKGEENKKNWNNIDGLYIGGGFPEDYGKEIAHSPYLRLIREYAENGMPIYAECGGLILLGASLLREGQSWNMAGVLKSRALWHSRPCGLGYVEARVKTETPFFPAGAILKGHEFHYSECDVENGDYCLELTRGTGITGGEKNYDGLCYKNVFASYTHIFAPAVPCWAENFVIAVKKYVNEE